MFVACTRARNKCSDRHGESNTGHVFACDGACIILTTIVVYTTEKPPEKFAFGGGRWTTSELHRSLLEMIGVVQEVQATKGVLVVRSVQVRTIPYMLLGLSGLLGLLSMWVL